MALQRTSLFLKKRSSVVFARALAAHLLICRSRGSEITLGIRIDRRPTINTQANNPRR
jgi:hypothetical protein